MSTFTTAESTVTFTHEGVLVSPSGRIKIARTFKKFWRLWIYIENFDVWVMQKQVFECRESAQAAAEMIEAVT